MWLSSHSAPDFRTINHFRGKRLKDQIQKLFAEVVRLLHDLNYLSLDVQYIDGTKIESAANRYTFVWKGAVEKNKAKLETKIEAVLHEIASQIKQDQSALSKDETPRPIDSGELRTRLAALNEHVKDIDKPTRKNIKKLEEDYLVRLEKYENQQEGKQSKEVIADAYVKYNYFHKEQKRAQKQNPFLVQNLYYNESENYFVCPMGQKLTHTGQGERKSRNGFISQVDYYEAKRCEGCPLRGMCHKSTGNKKIEINHKLNEYKSKAREMLTSERGLFHRSKRPIEVEAVFGQLKSNNKFSRFTLRKMEKVNIEFGLMSIGHNLRKLAKRAS